MKLPLTALILAGGDSRRMGRDKALLRVRGLRAVDLAVAYYGGLVQAVRVASGARRIPRVRAPQLPDPAGARGPLAGLAVGLEFSPTPWVLLVACDQPLLPRPLLLLMWKERRAGRALALRADSPLPMPALFPRTIRVRLDRLLAEGKGPRALLRGARLLPTGRWRAADPQGRATGGWNTPAGFRRWIRTAFDPLLPRP